MWINEYMAAQPLGTSSAATGQIRSAANGSVAVSSTRDYGALPMLAPAGVACVPVPGASTVVMDSAGGAVCLGVVAIPPEPLEPGEVMLYSAGGASIVLKNSGKVLINGREVG